MKRAGLIRLCTVFLLAVGLLLEAAGAETALADSGYAVKSGDTLWDIAVRFDTSVRAIAQANGIRNEDFIYVGQKLTIPDGTERVVARGTQEAARSQPTPSAPSRARPAPSAGPRSVVANKRIVTYYGNPWAAGMGVLGRYDAETVMAKLREQVAEYAPLSDKPVQPALHMVATVAQAGPGWDGMYRLRMPASVIEEYAQMAERNGFLLFLDLQVGRSSVEAEVNAVRTLLERPNIHLALDPEFDMGPGKVPGDYIGTTDAAQINWTVDVLASIATQNDLPNKILIVHQFMESMITNKTAIRTSPNVDVVIDMDGFGGQAAKLSKYDWLASEPVQFAGIKLFYREDTDLISPAQLMALDPRPDVIIYQ